MKQSGAIQTCRFGVRRHYDDGSTTYFEVFDRMTGVAVSSTMRRVEAEEDARRRNHDTSGRPTVMVRLALRSPRSGPPFTPTSAEPAITTPESSERFYELVYAHPNNRG